MTRRRSGEATAAAATATRIALTLAGVGVVAVVAAGSGCGKRSFDEMVTIVPAAVHGSVGGQAVDFYDGAGVAD
ncbi:MAG TPA: hypothetical protein VG389_14065, partial [Myxococcota bacterium]|nr:hypothetical protein [Myxococcota bacterium]